MTSQSISRTRRFRNIAGPVIRRLRNARGWTQAELAVKVQIAGLDLGRADIGKIESQLRSVYDYELFILSAVLNVGAAELSPGLKATKASISSLRHGYRSAISK